jgi:hypothetical protein
VLRELNIRYTVWLSLVLVAHAIVIPAVATMATSSLDDMVELSAADPRPCGMPFPSWSRVNADFGNLYDPDSVAGSVLCGFGANLSSGASPNYVDQAVTMLLGSSAGNLTYQQTSAELLARRFCEVGQSTDYVTPDPLLRITRAYLQAQPAFAWYASMRSPANADRTECRWASNPFNAERCSAHVDVERELVEAAAHPTSLGFASQAGHPVPDVATMYYRIAALGALGEDDRKNNDGRCFGNKRAGLVSVQMCQVAFYQLMLAHTESAALTYSQALSGGYSGEPSSDPATLLPPPPSPPPLSKAATRGDEAGDYDIFYNEANSRTCASFRVNDLSPPAPPPSPPRDTINYVKADNTVYLLNNYPAPVQHCLRLLRIGPWNTDSLYGLPDIRAHASPYAGYPAAEGIGGGIFDSIVTEYWRAGALEDPRRQAMLFAVYRAAMTSTWVTPTLYIFGWYSMIGLWPMLFIISRQLQQMCCDPGDPTRLAKLANKSEIGRPSWGFNRYAAFVTAIFVVLWQFLVYPFPSMEQQRPSCDDNEGRVYATTDKFVPVVIGTLSLALFVGSVLFYATCGNAEARGFSEGPEGEKEKRNAAQLTSLFFALLALPGSVVSLVDAQRSLLELIPLLGDNWPSISEAVDEASCMAEVLYVTAAAHGAAVGVFSNAWIALHPSAENGLGYLQYSMMTLGVLLAASPRLYKLTFYSDIFFFPEDRHILADIFAYAAEIGLGVTAILFHSNSLFGTKLGGDNDFYSDALRSLKRRAEDLAFATADGARAAARGAASGYRSARAAVRRRTVVEAALEKRPLMQRLPPLHGLKL